VRIQRDVYEGSGSHGILRTAAGIKGVHSVLRALPSEGYFQAAFGAGERSGEPPAVTISPLLETPAESLSPGNLERDLTRAAMRHPETETVMLVRSETALLTGEDLPSPTLPPHPETGQETRFVTCEEVTPGTGEFEAADLALEELVRAHATPMDRTPAPTVNVFGPPPLNPGAAAEYAETVRLLDLIGVGVNACVPLGSSVADLSRLSQAWANVLLYREVGDSATLYLQDTFGTPRVTTPMIGAAGTGSVLRTVGGLCGIDANKIQRVVWSELGQTAKLPWFARLIPPEDLRGKRATIFGDLTYTLGLGYALAREVGLEVTCAGTYLEHLEQDFLFHTNSFTDQAFVTGDPEEAGARIEEANPDLLIGTRLEREVANALGIPFLQLCAPAGARVFVEKPLMGYVGSSVLADLLEGALSRGREYPKTNSSAVPWTEEALEGLEEIPAFLRGRTRRLAEEYAKETHAREITRDVLERSRR
jgi:light-independent protochlorophyllide reductase subunit B